MSPRVTMSWRIALLPALLAVAGCAGLHTQHCAPGEQSLLSETLYFGTRTPAGVVTPAQWQQFLATAVTPRFPQGLSVWPAAGQWRGRDGAVVSEDSYVLTLVHADDETSEAAIRAIIADYKARFTQEAVLRVKSPACASF